MSPLLLRPGSYGNAKIAPEAGTQRFPMLHGMGLRKTGDWAFVALCKTQIVLGRRLGQT